MKKTKKILEQQHLSERKCVVRIRGGLGNQLFQYAFAYLVCSKTGIADIIMDIREYDNYYWPFELSKFKLRKNSVSSKLKQKYDKSINLYHLSVFFYRLFHKKQSQDFYDHRLLKKGFIFCGRECNLPKLQDNIDYYLYGYFQNSFLLNDIRDELINMYSLKKISSQVTNYISLIKTNSLSISIRFPNSNEIKRNINYKYAEKEKYLELIKSICKKRSSNLQIVVSSNDIERIIEEGWFDGYDVLFIKNCTPCEQIEVLKHCRDFVLSNSTFSWWIAYIGSYNKDSIVLAPRLWFSGVDIHKTHLLFANVSVFD